MLSFGNSIMKFMCGDESKKNKQQVKTIVQQFQILFTQHNKLIKKRRKKILYNEVFKFLKRQRHKPLLKMDRKIWILSIKKWEYKTDKRAIFDVVDDNDGNKFQLLLKKTIMENSNWKIRYNFVSDFKCFK